MKKYLRHLKRYLLPHKRNGYKPRIFNRQSVASLILCLLLLEGIYLFQVHVVLKNAGFLASVLPAAITSLTNADRSSQGLNDLTEDSLLATAAQAKADDMAAKGYFAHVAPDGKTPWYWFDSVKYPYTYAGENLAVDFTDSKDVETAWMNSPLHRANILKAEYTRIGIGISQGMYQGRLTTFVVQFFATRSQDRISSSRTTSTAIATTPASVPVTTRRTSVLASETSPTPKKTPVATPVAPVAETPAAQPVTVAESAPTASLAIAETSPSHFMLYLLSALSGFFLIILLMTLIAHLRRQVVYMEVLAGGFVLVGVVAIMLVFNQNALPGVPSTAESASASIAL